VPLYERGYEKDPAKVAAEAIRVAQRDGRDVVLVDTAGRMQVGVWCACACMQSLHSLGAAIVHVCVSLSVC
jgi:signal recognition particle GTPase